MYIALYRTSERKEERERDRREAKEQESGEGVILRFDSLGEAGHELFFRIIWFFYGGGQSVSADKRIKPVPTTATAEKRLTAL